MIALSTGSLYSYGTARVFELAARVGYDGIEVLVDQRPDTRDPAYLRRLSTEHNLPIVALHSPFASQAGDWPSDPLGRLKRTVALAQDLDVPVVVTHLPLRFSGLYIWWRGSSLSGRLTLPFPWPRHGAYYDLLRVEGLAEMEAATGITIAVENMPAKRFLGRPASAHWFNHPEQMVRFPHVTLDTTHVGTWGWDLLQAYEQVKGRLAHVHLSNYNGQEHRTPLDGHLPLDALLGRLAQDGYPGTVSIESCPEGLNAEDAGQCRATLEQALAFCRQHLADA